MKKNQPSEFFDWILYVWYAEGEVAEEVREVAGEQDHPLTVTSNHHDIMDTLRLVTNNITGAESGATAVTHTHRASVRVSPYVPPLELGLLGEDHAPVLVLLRF